MPHPFPGMNPYLERPSRWKSLHTRLIVQIADVLGPRLRPRYIVAPEVDAYLADPWDLKLAGQPDAAFVEQAFSPSGRPSPSSPHVAGGAVAVEVPAPEEVRERYLEVRDAASGEVVTVLEILSPANKRSGKGRERYETKRWEVLGTRTNLVEIDLLRDGKPMAVRGAPQMGQYRIPVSRGERRPRADLFPFGVRDPIPVFTVPLRRGDEEPPLDVGALLQVIYDVGSYDIQTDYRAEPEPPLDEEDRSWADDLLRRASLR